MEIRYRKRPGQPIVCRCGKPAHQFEFPIIRRRPQPGAACNFVAEPMAVEFPTSNVERDQDPGWGDSKHIEKGKTDLLTIIECEINDIGMGKYGIIFQFNSRN
jgi:hypothetical protein